MTTPQFHTDPLSSTHRFHTRTTLFQHPNPSVHHQKKHSVQHQNPSVPHQKPVSTTSPSVPHQRPLSSTPKILQCRTPLSFTPKTLQFNTQKKSEIFDQKFIAEHWFDLFFIFSYLGLRNVSFCMISFKSLFEKSYRKHHKITFAWQIYVTYMTCLYINIKGSSRLWWTKDRMRL